MALQERGSRPEVAAQRNGLLPVPVEYEAMPDLLDLTDGLEVHLRTTVADRRGFLRGMVGLRYSAVTVLPRLVRESAVRSTNYPGFPFSPVEVQRFIDSQPRAGGSFLPLTFHTAESGQNLSRIAEMYETPLAPWVAANRRATGKGPNDLRIGTTLLAAVAAQKGPIDTFGLVGETYPFVVDCTHLGIAVFQDQKGRTHQQWRWQNKYGGSFTGAGAPWQHVDSPRLIFAHKRDYAGDLIHGLRPRDYFETSAGGVSTVWRVSDLAELRADEDARLLVGDLKPGPDQLRLYSCLSSEPDGPRRLVTASRIV